VYGDGRRGGGKWDSQGGGKRERDGKLCNIAQYFVIEKSAKRREPTKIRREPGLKGTGSRKFKSPCPAPPPPFNLSLKVRCKLLSYRRHQLGERIVSVFQKQFYVFCCSPNPFKIVEVSTIEG